MHGESFVSLDGKHRICQLDEGHEGPCAGPLDQRVIADAKKRIQAERRRIQAQQIAERAATLTSGLSSSLTPAQFSALVLEAARSGAVSFQAALQYVCRKTSGGPLVVNGRPADVSEVRQVAYRLQRDGQAIVAGDTVQAA